ncbi:hypothetical protein OAK35_03410 [Crocinitomicaceae bacterium]|nr:hypothetical protein [Crocinitomicaceae bacterium]
MKLPEKLDKTRDLTKMLEIPPFFLDDTISATSTHIDDDVGFEFSDKLVLDNI